jgi:transketolase
MQDINLNTELLAIKKSAYLIRKHIIETILTNGEGHVGGALSSADIIAVLFSKYLPALGFANPDRNRFILSAGHKCLALYSALVVRGIVSQDVLKTYNQLNTVLPGHPDMKKLAGVDFSTGSLGHGLPIGCGMALGSKLRQNKSMIYVLMGDGEQGEGSNWEAATFAKQYQLDNLVGIIDRNQLQINGTTKQVMDTDNLALKYQAFGWGVRVIDGHDLKVIDDTLSCVPFEQGKPSMIIADTVKGKGLPFAENNVKFHHWHASNEQITEALAAIEALAMEANYE